MAYETLATSRNPALIVYLLDVSASMTQMMGSKRRMDVVTEALQAVLQQIVFRCTKGGRVSPRYRVAMYAYSDYVYDLLDGIKTIDQVASFGVPELSPMRSTDTARAFMEVEKLLQRELSNLQDCPAPLVCHMTDGEYTGANPEPIARRIMGLKVPDGNVLVENIFISDQVLTEPVKEIQNWPGVQPTTPLASDYAARLRAISSPLPTSYLTMMTESGYQLSGDSLMLLPGTSPELVEMGFVMSVSTPISK